MLPMPSLGGSGPATAGTHGTFSVIGGGGSFKKVLPWLLLAFPVVVGLGWLAWKFYQKRSK